MYNKTGVDRLVVDLGSLIAGRSMKIANLDISANVYELALETDCSSRQFVVPRQFGVSSSILA